VDERDRRMAQNRGSVPRDQRAFGFDTMAVFDTEGHPVPLGLLTGGAATGLNGGA